MIRHDWIGTTVEIIPRQKVRAIWVRVPGFILKEFLTQEKLGNPWRSQQNRGGDPAAASGVPGTMIGRVGQRRDTRVAPRHEEVMIFDTGHRAPCVVESRRIERGCYGGDGNRRLGSAGGGPDRVAQGAAQAVMLDDIETGTARGG